MSKEHPNAYREWVCPTCGGVLMEESTDTYDLRCESEGNTYRIEGNVGVWVPDPDEPEEGDTDD